MGIVSKIFGAGKTVNKALELADQYVVDKDERNRLMVELIKVQAQTDMQATIPWVDALHKMGRQLMWFAVIGFYMYATLNGVAVDLAELAAVCAGPMAYTLLKGVGSR